MTKANKFSAVIERGGEVVNSGYFVRVPSEVSAALGAHGQLRVVATIDGSDFRLALSRYGGAHWLILRAEVRTAIGKSTGDEISVALRPDLEPRVVELPSELEAALAADPAAKVRWESLSYSHRREHALYVADAKKAETKIRRSAKVLEALTAANVKPAPPS